MMFTRLNYVLAVLAVVVVSAAAMLNTDRTRPHYEIMPDMKYSPAYDAYGANPNFADGRTMRSPVAGTVARGEEPLDFAATPEDAIRAGEELRNPVFPEPSDRQNSLSRGAKNFRVYCAVCHGGSGEGDGPVAQRGFPPPPSLLTGKSLKMKDGQLFHIQTYGQGSMPPFAAQLSPQQRWDVVNYIRSIQPDAKPSDDADETREESPEGTTP